MSESRGELLSWLNSVLPSSLHNCIGGEISKVEQCGSGIPYVYLLPRLFPLSPAAIAAPAKVKFPARQEYDASTNLKIVQEVFSRNHVDHTMDIDRMSKRNFQANLEFLQQFKRLCDQKGLSDGSGGADTSSASAATAPQVTLRLNSAPAAGGSPGSAIRKSSAATSVVSVGSRISRPLFGAAAAALQQTSSRSAGNATNVSGSSGGVVRPVTASSAQRLAGAPSVMRNISPSQRSKSPLAQHGIAVRSITPTPSSTRSSVAVGGGSGLRPRSSASGGSEDTLTYTDLERRFYYDKLRKIEDLVRRPASEGNNELAVAIQKILYSTH